MARDLDVEPFLKLTLELATPANFLHTQNSTRIDPKQWANFVSDY